MPNTKKLLSQDPRQAVEDMIKITEELMARIEIESNAVAINDGTTFTINEMNKEQMAEKYQQAANEFHARANEFRGMDKKLIDRLEAAQKSLGQSTKTNLKLLQKIMPKG